MKITDKQIKAYALKNAVTYNGKAQQGSVLSSLFHEGLDKKDVKKYVSTISKIISEVNSLSLEEQKKEYEKLKEKVSERKIREGLPELSDVKSKGVIMRFAPSPSGALHIGHALTSCISFDYVKEYGGTFYVRIEDTNPDNIYPPAYKLIEKDSEWLFDKKAKIIIQSDRMDLYYSYAEKLISKDKAYVCTCSGDEFRKYSIKKQECPCRNLEIKEQKIRWKKMLDKKGYEPGQAVLRFKSSDGMTNPNPAMRDFPLARINLTKHPKQGTKYRVWPLMNLSVSVDDMEEKMTHIIRAKDHRDNATRQKMIYEVFNKKYPWEAYLGRWKLKDMNLSSTEITAGIKSGKFSGWDDLKLLTVASLKKQGYKPQAFWKLAEQIGLSESDKTIDKQEFFKLLKTFNRG